MVCGILFFCLTIIGCASNSPSIQNTQTPKPTVFKPTSTSPFGNLRDIPPPENTWNYKVEFANAVYYAMSYEKTDVITIRGFWEWKDKQWVWTDYSMTIPISDPNIPVKVTARTALIENPSKDNLYFWAPTSSDMNKVIKLNIIGVWEGSESKDIPINTKRSPLVVNGMGYVNSKISSSFNIHVVISDINGIKLLENPRSNSTGLQAVVVNQMGQFAIQVQASGASWWIKAGIE
jgi:hypothetical protein